MLFLIVTRVVLESLLSGFVAALLVWFMTPEKSVTPEPDVPPP